ncbi:hypothetical protein T02_13500 [Trichinella nativa]|uniref:Uncharacterized protein n=1 Tax=Trichinella nativa TaxID=6335 RepID=A0A0V1KSH8_9BILA|nr:hypothetical protein T02_13500 [Trichinella nativa]
MKLILNGSSTLFFPEQTKTKLSGLSTKKVEARINDLPLTLISNEANEEMALIRNLFLISRNPTSKTRYERRPDAFITHMSVPTKACRKSCNNYLLTNVM